MREWYIKAGCITSYSGKAVDVVIPSEIYSQKVVQINMYAFSPVHPKITGEASCLRDTFQSVCLPDGAMFIEKEAFGCCKKLPRIELPSGLERIGSAAFYGCHSLKSIV